MTRLGQFLGRPRCGGVDSRVAAVIVVAFALGACSGGSTRAVSTTSAPVASTTTTTVIRGRLASVPLSAFPDGWVATTVDADANSRDLEQRCPRVAAILRRADPSTHDRITYASAAEPIPSVTIDSRDFGSEAEVLRRVPQFASAEFVDCLRNVYGAAPLALAELRVERLVAGVFGDAISGYRVTGTTGTAPQVEHVVAEIVVVPVASSLAVVTFSSTLRFPIAAEVEARIVAALRDLR